MGKATEAAAALRAQLAEAEKAEKTEKAAEAAEKRRVQRAKDEADTDAFREENYEATAGDYGNYVGVSTSYNGGFHLEIVDWTSVQSSISLNRAESVKLRDTLNNLLG